MMLGIEWYNFVLYIVCEDIVLFYEVLNKFFNKF